MIRQLPLRKEKELFLNTSVLQVMVFICHFFPSDSNNSMKGGLSPVYQMRHLRLRKFKYLVLTHSVNKQKSWYSISTIIPKSMVFLEHSLCPLSLLHHITSINNDLVKHANCCKFTEEKKSNEIYFLLWSSIYHCILYIESNLFVFFFFMVNEQLDNMKKN